MLVVSVCENFGWTYEEYLNQPQFFLDLIVEKMKIDNQKLQNELKKK